MSSDTFEKPVVLTAKELEEVRLRHNPKIVDIYQKQLEELKRIDNPSGNSENSTADGQKATEAWIYYPWRNTLLHSVSESDLFRLRTNRNKELITADEQEKLANTVVGVAGMSVGSGIAMALSYSGMAQTIKVADFDELDTSNLNRLRESLLDVGRPKVTLAAERIHELNPYANVDIYAEGLTNENIDNFFDHPKLNVVVDEIDDFKMKVRLRLEARKRQVPLLMFTSLGDNILVDVERYDLDPKLALFNGGLGDNGDEILAKGDISPEDIRKYSVQLVGPQYIPTRALQSVAEMGKTLVGRPQLYSTIAVDGGLAAYTIRQIILGDGPKSGRYFVKFSELLGIANDELSDSVERDEILKRLRG